MNRSLARSLTLTLAFFIAALTLTPVAGANKLRDVNLLILHGNYAFGYAGRSYRPASLNLKTGKLRFFALPPGATTLVPSKASAAAMVAVSDNNSTGYMSEPQGLYRFDNRTGRGQKLDSISRGEDWCRDEIVPISISDDGTVIAEFRVEVPGPQSCVVDAARSFLRRYPAGDVPSEDVWLPAKYQPWLNEQLLDANGNSVAIATRGDTSHPGAVAVLDIADRKVLAEREQAGVGKLSLANPHSLYIASSEAGPSGPPSTGRMEYWRIGNGEPRTLYSGQISPHNSTTCGNRALVATNRRLWIIGRNGKVELKRRLGPKGSLSGIVCSTDLLQYLGVSVQEGGTGEYPFVKFFVNISKLR